MNVVQGPTGKEPLAEGVYPVEINVNNNNNNKHIIISQLYCVCVSACIW